MDQQSLYEQAASNSDAGHDDSIALGGRDRFVIEDLRNKFRNSSQFNIAELSIGDGRMTMAMLSALPNVVPESVKA